MDNTVVCIPILSLLIKCLGNYNLDSMHHFVNFFHPWSEVRTKSSIGDFKVRVNDLGDGDRATELLSVTVQLGATCLWIDSKSAAHPRRYCTWLNSEVILMLSCIRQTFAFSSVRQTGTVKPI